LEESATGTDVQRAWVPRSARRLVVINPSLLRPRCAWSVTVRVEL
jgi:hypothetical protein